MSDFVPHLVSTIIPVYNRPEMIKAAVDSVLAQDYRPIEIIIVDDGSTDDTLEACNTVASLNPGIVEVISRPNGGPGPAREAGRVRSRGEFIQYLDSDDRLLPGKFTTQVDLLRSSPDCGIAYGVTQLIGDEGQVLANPFKWTGEDRLYLFPGLLVDRWWCTHTPLYRRSVCDDIGPWSDLRYSQDWEYDARAGSLGIRLVNSHTIVSEHRMHMEARQTGHGNWLAPSEQVQFFSALYKCAETAGVSASAPEMRHFARWVFARARNCGATGAELAAQQLFQLALEASEAPDLIMRTTGASAALFGWKRTGNLARLYEALKIGAGAGTQRQSWMKD